MTEQQWLTYSGDPEAMLHFLPSIGKASERKLRLFAVACCRYVLARVKVGPRAEHALEVAERYADGQGSASDLQEARCYANSEAEHACMNAAETEDAVVMASCASLNAAWGAAKHGAKPPDDNSLSAIFNARLAAEQVIQCGFLRDIFGPLPFLASLPTVPPHIINDRTIAGLVEVCYDQRVLPGNALDPTLLGVLADALEDAGCIDSMLLEHLRSLGCHTHGCWAVDLVLGRK